MRNRKIRVWDIKDKSMEYINDLYWFEENYVHDFSGEALYTIYIYMENVGFLDKNNKEIFEGDIDASGYVVTYLANLKDGYGMEAGWYLQRDNFESWSELECNEDIEIIGNVFETPWRAINNCNTDYVEYFKTH
jgi:hypothetical protein